MTRGARSSLGREGTSKCVREEASSTAGRLVEIGETVCVHREDFVVVFFCNLVGSFFSNVSFSEWLRSIFRGFFIGERLWNKDHIGSC